MNEPSYDVALRSIVVNFVVKNLFDYSVEILILITIITSFRSLHFASDDSNDHLAE
jgi:hypothetical protein